MTQREEGKPFQVEGTACAKVLGRADGSVSGTGLPEWGSWGGYVGLFVLLINELGLQPPNSGEQLLALKAMDY